MMPIHQIDQIDDPTEWGLIVMGRWHLLHSSRQTKQKRSCVLCLPTYLSTYYLPRCCSSSKVHCKTALSYSGSTRSCFFQGLVLVCFDLSFFRSASRKGLYCSKYLYWHTYDMVVHACVCVCACGTKGMMIEYSSQGVRGLTGRRGVLSSLVSKVPRLLHTPTRVYCCNSQLYPGSISTLLFSCAYSGSSLVHRLTETRSKYSYICRSHPRLLCFDIL